MWLSILFGLFLIVLSALMLVRNRAAWRSARVPEAESSEADNDFPYRQYRLRRQANALMAIVGLAIIGGVWVTDTKVAAMYWLGVFGLVCWMALLAVADLVTTRSYYGQLQRDQIAERALLEAELNQLRRRDGNGRPNHKPIEDLE